MAWPPPSLPPLEATTTSGRSVWQQVSLGGLAAGLVGLGGWAGLGWVLTKPTGMLSPFLPLSSPFTAVPAPAGGADLLTAMTTTLTTALAAQTTAMTTTLTTALAAQTTAMTTALATAMTTALAAQTASLAQLLRPAKATAAAPGSGRVGSSPVVSAAAAATGSSPPGRVPSPLVPPPGSPGGSTPRGGLSPAPPNIALDDAVASLTPEALAGLRAASAALKAAVGTPGPLLQGPAMAALATLGLHRLLTGPLRDSITSPKHYDYFLGTGSDDTPHVFQRPPASTTAAAAAGDNAAAGGCSSPLPAAVHGVSTFIVAADSEALRKAAHSFMVASIKAKGKVECTWSLSLPTADSGLSIWLDEVLAYASIPGEASIPIIFHVTIAPAQPSMPETAFLTAVSQLGRMTTLCCFTAAAEPLEELELPPPAWTDPLLATPAAKSLARQAFLSDPGSGPSSGPRSGSTSSPPETVVLSPVLGLQQLLGAE